MGKPGGRRRAREQTRPGRAGRAGRDGRSGSVGRFGRAGLLLLVVTLVAAAGCRPKPEFYVPPSGPPSGGGPGDVVRSMQVLFDRAYEVRGTAVMYRSTSATGEDNVVTGTVYVPRSPWTGGGNRPIVGFGPGTQGLGDGCAPSLSLPTGKNYETDSVRRLLDEGWAVAVTDYEKLGPPGDHTYFVKDAEAHALLDIARAAQRLPEAAGWGIGPDSPVALWGYSQGGQAAAAAAEIEATYAPELNVVAAIAGGVPADPDGMVEHLDGDGNAWFTFLAFAAVGLSSAYPELDLASYLNDAGAQLFADGRSVCLFDALPLGIGRHIAELTTSDPLATPAWQARLDQQRLGVAGTRPTVPVMLFHGSADQIIPPAQGRGLRDAWCSAGSPVTYREYPVDHLGGIAVGLTDGIAFLTAALAHQPVAPTCAA